MPGVDLDTLGQQMRQPTLPARRVLARSPVMRLRIVENGLNAIAHTASRRRDLLPHRRQHGKHGGNVDLGDARRPDLLAVPRQARSSIGIRVFRFRHALPWLCDIAAGALPEGRRSLLAGLGERIAALGNQPTGNRPPSRRANGERDGRVAAHAQGALPAILLDEENPRFRQAAGPDFEIEISAIGMPSGLAECLDGSVGELVQAAPALEMEVSREIVMAGSLLVRSEVTSRARRSGRSGRRVRHFPSTASE